MGQYAIFSLYEVWVSSSNHGEVVKARRTNGEGHEKEKMHLKGGKRRMRIEGQGVNLLALWADAVLDRCVKETEPLTQ